MILGTSSGLPLRDVLHWTWLWVLVTIIVTMLQSFASGQQPIPFEQLDPLPLPTQGEVDPIPMPNIDRPELFRYPQVDPTQDSQSLHQILHLNRKGDFKQVLKTWRTVHVTEECVTWKHVGVGVAYLRLDDLDRAKTELSNALRLDPQNAVAEYFLGQVFRAQGRKVPFWYEQDRASPYRLIGYRSIEGVEAIDEERSQLESFLPHFKSMPFDKQAKRHFRRAIRLAPHCDLNRVIEVVEPEIKMVSLSDADGLVTVRHLLQSLGEVDYLEKAQSEFGERFVRE